MMYKLQKCRSAVHYLAWKTRQLWLHITATERLLVHRPIGFIKATSLPLGPLQEVWCWLWDKKRGGKTKREEKGRGFILGNVSSWAQTKETSDLALSCSKDPDHSQQPPRPPPSSTLPPWLLCFSIETICLCRTLLWTPDAWPSQPGCLVTWSYNCLSAFAAFASTQTFTATQSSLLRHTVRVDHLVYRIFLFYSSGMRTHACGCVMEKKIRYGERSLHWTVLP